MKKKEIGIQRRKTGKKESRNVKYSTRGKKRKNTSPIVQISLKLDFSYQPAQKHIKTMPFELHIELD